MENCYKFLIFLDVYIEARKIKINSYYRAQVETKSVLKVLKKQVFQKCGRDRGTTRKFKQKKT